MSISGRFFGIAAGLSILAALLPFGVLWSVLIVNFALIAVGLIDLYMAPKTATIAFERDLAPMVVLNTETTLEWTLSNSAGRRAHVRFADELKPSLNAETRRAEVHVPANGRVMAETKLRPKRRGRFVLNKVTVRTYGPLGLAARQRTRDVETVLRVYPSFKSRKEAELRVQKAQMLEIGLQSVRAKGGGTEFDQLREYTVDDDFRRLDWAATARANKPIVRTYRAEQNQNVVILLDCGRVMAGRVDGVPRLEHAMDAVMALSAVATRLGDRVGMIAFDQSIRGEVASRSGSAQFARITEAMYALEPELIESDYRRAFVHALSRFRRRSLVVVLTELAEQAVTETLMPALPLISRRHMVVVASVRDLDVNKWARALPTDEDKAYLKAAAVDSLDKRRRLVAELKSRSAMVVDAAPGKLAGQLADTYLQAKASGRL